MKKTIKVFAAIMLITALVFSIAACGFDVKKIAGDWTLDNVNGKSSAEMAATYGTPLSAFLQNCTFTDKNVTTSAIANGAINSATYELQIRANGVEAHSNGAVVMSFVYDEKADTLTMGVQAANGEILNYVFKRGTTDLQAQINAESDAAAPAEEEAPAEEGGEEYSEEYCEEYGEYAEE